MPELEKNKILNRVLRVLRFASSHSENWHAKESEMQTDEVIDDAISAEQEIDCCRVVHWKLD